MKMEFSIRHIAESSPFYETTAYTYWILMKGKCTIRTPHDTYTLPAHTVIVFPAGCRFQMRYTGSLEIGEVRREDYTATNSSIEIIPAEHTGMIRRIFYLAYDSQEDPDMNTPEIRQSLFQLFYETVFHQYRLHYSGNPVVENVIRSLLEKYRDPSYNLNEEIQKTGYSMSHFRKLFHAQTGTSPMHFLALKRIEYACTLLRQDRNLPIQEAAQRSGFSNALYFSRLFRSCKGMSPRAYRDQPDP